MELISAAFAEVDHIGDIHAVDRAIAVGITALYRVRGRPTP